MSEEETTPRDSCSVAFFPRQSLKVERVAQLLDCDQSYVRKLVRKGYLESYRVGKRGVRIFVDSIFAYQQGKTIAFHGCFQPTVKSDKNHTFRSRSYEKAVEALKKSGIL
jgi:excisionase family DNA binding protein